MTESSIKDEIIQGDLELRFVDPRNTNDLDSIQMILRSPAVQFFMDNVEDTSRQEIVNWANEGQTKNSFLFALSKGDKIEGFIYFYPSDVVEGAMEISGAKSPDAHPGYIPAILKKACLKVSGLLGEFDGTTKPLTKIVAEIEPDNWRSREVVKRSGFEYVGEKIWELNWDKIGWRNGRNDNC